MYAWHKSVGITVLALAVLRLLWRWANPTPTLPSTLKAYERVLANLTHQPVQELRNVAPTGVYFECSWWIFPGPVEIMR